ncbi:hypothetical protein [Clostridium sp.]|uniref:hypothetical protein n=1 Tax=Clostridium sp. TaxID=1506 RepID=UPI0025BFB7A6|nr:hypothetical protein [Clostridium sp.]
MNKIKLMKNCTRCEFNFKGICIGRDDIYGQEIKDIIENCDFWDADLDYYTYLTKETPWYIKEPFDDCKISYNKFLDYIDKDYNREEIIINLYTLIEKTLDINIFQLSEILGVKPTVVGHAKSRGTVPKRVEEFSIKLGIPSKFFRKTTNLDIPEIEELLKDFK